MATKAELPACPVETTLMEYTLTDLGHSMMPILDAMEQWGTAYKCSVKK